MAKVLTDLSALDMDRLGAYRLDHSEWLDDIKSLGMVFRHVKSGARVCVISNDDENKVFCAAFRTTPEDSTGVPHIIEHTVLCGSKKYPARDPFMQLAKGSLNTFLNAMTYPDKTAYPVASCNDKDFANLMNVYMDAVFYPNIYRHKEIFMQEGWHYELENADDELKINGVVYSEMKGAMSSPDRVIYDEIQHALFPDNTYGVESGGDPDVIPSLTYENYLNFHRRYYHPSNSYIFLYGDIDVEERLEWMDREYLSAFDAIDPATDIAPQKPFGGMKEVKKFYSLAENEDPAGKNYYALAARCGSYKTPEESMAWDILADVLVNVPGAPVKQALLDAGIAQDISASYYGEIMQPGILLVAKNAKDEDKQKFYDIVIDTLKQQVKDGISEKSLLAAINISEFKYREADFGSAPKGLFYDLDMLQSWLYDDSMVFTRMHGSEFFAFLKSKIGTGYYEKLIEDTILHSDHALFLTLAPEKGLVDKKNAELKEKLAAYKAGLTADEINNIVEETKALRAYQSAEPTEEELNCVPFLSRSDIKKEANPYVYEEGKIGDVPALFHDINTNGISYIRLMFDIGGMPKEYLPLLGLLGSVLGKVDTAEHSFRDLSDEIRIHTGGISFGADSWEAWGKSDTFRPMAVVRFSAIGEEVKTALSLIGEILTSSKVSDTRRLKDILGEYLSDKQVRYATAGHAVSLARARSYLSRRALFSEETSGISQYEALKALMAQYETEKDGFAAKLASLIGWLFAPDKLFVDAAGDETGLNALKDALPALLDSLKTVSVPTLGEADALVPAQKNEGFMMAIGVQYLTRCGNLFDAGYPCPGVMRVLSNLVSNDYLYQNIRVKGGAYGCGCVIMPDCGDVGFWSYRDPNLKKTLDVYLAAPDFIRGLQIDEDEVTRAVIGTFSDIDSPLSASQKISRSLSAYLSGKTFADLQKERDEILSVTADDLRGCADAVAAVLAQGATCALGNEQKLREEGDIFSELRSLS